MTCVLDMVRLRPMVALLTTLLTADSLTRELTLLGVECEARRRLGPGPGCSTVADDITTPLMSITHLKYYHIINR